MDISPNGLPHFLKRVQEEWERTAGETLDVEYIKGTLYGYGSELAVLRLEHRYKIPTARAFYSKNLNTWAFALD
jgi:hypothetical protein